MAIVRVVELHPSVDLFRRPAVTQSLANRLVVFWHVQFPAQGPLTASTLGRLLRLGSPVLAARAVAAQLATNRGGAPIDLSRDLVLLITFMKQLRYAISFFLRKMTGHRWDSFPR